jgi:hypothetical protein
MGGSDPPPSPLYTPQRRMAKYIDLKLHIRYENYFFSCFRSTLLFLIDLYLRCDYVMTTIFALQVQYYFIMHMCKL